MLKFNKDCCYKWYSNNFKKLIFRISQYATASTSDSVYIIGGFTNGSPYQTSTIAEYNNESWKSVGNLAQARSGHGGITDGPITMVVGGYSASGSS